MNAHELRHLLVELGRFETDTQRYEVKRSRSGLPTGIHETLSAFANGDGGTVLLGIDEAAGFVVIGVEDPKRRLDELASACQRMDPPVRATIDTIDLDGHVVIEAHIPPIPRDQRPCHRADRPAWDSSYIRVADGDRKLTAYEVGLLLANRAPNRHDVAPVPDATRDDLDASTLREYISRARAGREPFRTRSDDEVLRMTNVLTGELGELRPTLAGLLAFGVYPQQFAPQLNVTLVVYPTPVAGVPGPHGERFLDNRSIDGSIPAMVRDTISTLKRHMSRRGVITGLVRVDEWEYPEEVLREALVNALAHRDYSSSARGSQVQVELYPDRLVIRNAGGLFGPLQVDQLGLRTVPASSRNPALLKLLEDTPLEPGRTVCENRGSGIVAMRAALVAAGMEPPKFDDDVATFTVTFPNHALLDEETAAWLATLDTAGLSRQQLAALALLKRGRAMTNQTYREATGVADSRLATTHLQELRRRGLVEQVGTRGRASYRLATAPAAGRRPRTGASGLRGRGALVLDSMTDEEMTRREIAIRTGLSDSQVVAQLRRLRSLGLVELVGPPRSRQARWRRSRANPLS